MKLMYSSTFYIGLRKRSFHRTVSYSNDELSDHVWTSTIMIADWNILKRGISSEKNHIRWCLFMYDRVSDAGERLA